jgi:hypothetical protein
LALSTNAFGFDGLNFSYAVRWVHGQIAYLEHSTSLLRKKAEKAKRIYFIMKRYICKELISPGREWMNKQVIYQKIWRKSLYGSAEGLKKAETTFIRTERPLCEILLETSNQSHSTPSKENKTVIN